MTDETPQAEAPKRARRAPAGPSSELAKRRAERKARGENNYGPQKRLTTAGAVLDHENYQYRWENDETGRIAQMQNAEWEIVTEDELNGLTNDRHAGLNREGKAMNAVLMKKYKPWFEEDQAEKLKESQAYEEQVRKGQIKASDPEDGERFYGIKGSTTSATPTKRAS